MFHVAREQTQVHLSIWLKLDDGSGACDIIEFKEPLIVGRNGNGGFKAAGQRD